MRQTAIYLAALLLLGCEQIPVRNVSLATPHYVGVRELVLDDGRRIPVPPPALWDANTDVFRQWAQVGNIAELRYTDDQGREVVGNFQCVYGDRDDTKLFAALEWVIRYRRDGTKETATEYDGHGSPIKWISYSDDGKHENVVVKEYVDPNGKPYLQWVAVPDRNGRMRAYGLKENETDNAVSLRVALAEVNEPLE
jgi:hypothetical protein